MNSKLPDRWALPPTWLRFLVIVVLLLGVFFRFVNLERKVYWFDETFTSLRISGYTMSEAVEEVCNGREIGVEDLQKYQRPAPGKTLTDTINSLAIEDPQHPPLYYVMARFWVQWFGSSVAVTRSLSAFISLLTFPCIYWLCLELFNSSLTGWVAIALLAVSSFHVLYAQEAREYCLWTVTILLSSATLLRAMRLKTKFSWGMYAVTVVLGLYTFMFSALVTIAHGIYVVTTERFRLTKTVIAYLLASLVGFLAFTPWLVVTITHLGKVQETTGWTASEKTNLLSLIKNWVINLSYFFVDFGYDLGRYDAEPKLKFIAKCLIPFILILVGYSIYFLCRNTPKQVWLFVLTLIGVTALPLVIPDLIFGGVRSLIPRYLIPFYLGIQLAVAYLLATQISFDVNIWRQKLWQAVAVALLSVGIISCAISYQAETWWLKYQNIYTHKVVAIVNQATQPLVISSCKGTWSLLGDELSLSYLLAPKVRFQLVNESNVPPISNNFNHVFFYNPSHNPFIQKVQYQLENEQKFQIKKDVYPKKLGLWKLAK